MSTCTLSFDLPEELVASLGSRDDLAAHAKEAFVFELLREERIGQGKAGEILGIERQDVVDKMVKYQIPAGPVTAEEVRRETKVIEHLADDWRLRARRQR